MNSKTGLVPLPLLLLAACVSQGPTSQIGSEQQAAAEIEMARTSDCAFQSTISGFDRVDDRHVVLYGLGHRQAYLAELSPGCFNVGMQATLAAVDGDGNGQICGYGRDSVAYRGLGKVEHCRIMALEKLTDDRRVQLGLDLPPQKPASDEKDGEEN
jgi:Family of unknown function (DUF6491)